MNIQTKALNFCMEARSGQTRKYTGEPYYLHCQEVARMVALKTEDADLIVAALLHDTLEDTSVTFEDIEKEFGARVADLVLELTDEFTKENYPELNRTERKLRERQRIAGTSAEARLIKLYDLADNTSTIVKHDPNFAVVYLREKALLLEAMGFSANADLV